MEEERKERLDPDNRPDGAEVDNTDRTFDVERGMYTDSEEYDESEPLPSATKRTRTTPTTPTATTAAGTATSRTTPGTRRPPEDEAEDKDHDSGDNKDS